MVLGHSMAYGHQHGFMLQYRPWTFTRPLVATQATDINTDSGHSMATDSGTVFGSSITPDISVVSGGYTGHSEKMSFLNSLYLVIYFATLCFNGHNES